MEKKGGNLLGNIVVLFIPNKPIEIIHKKKRAPKKNNNNNKFGYKKKEPSLFNFEPLLFQIFFFLT